MNFAKVSLCCSLAVVFLVSVSAGKGHWKGGMNMWKNMTCKGEQINMKEAWKGKKECWDEVVPKPSTTAAPSEDGKPKWNKDIFKMGMTYAAAISVCQLKKSGVLKADGTYDSTGAETQIKAIFPESIQESLKKEYDTCASTHGSEFSMDDNCKGYANFTKCLKDKAIEACGMKEKMEEMKKKWQEKQGKAADGVEPVGPMDGEAER